MHSNLLQLLACPACTNDLYHDLDIDGREKIESGNLLCTSCKRSYPVINGIPRLILGDFVEPTVKRFGEQWHLYSFIDPLYKQQFLDWIHPVQPSFFKDKVVLDAGCGKGRHALLAREFGAKLVVALDASNSVDVAQANAHPYSNIEVVQGDILHPPFKPGSFDYVYSIGVLHHLPVPYEGFYQLTQLIKQGGHISIWVYGLENNEWIVRWFDPIRKHITSRLPAPILRVLSRCAALFLTCSLRYIYKPLMQACPGLPLFYKDYFQYISSFPTRELENIIFDHLVPEYAHYLPYQELKEWFQDFEDVTIKWHNRNSWRCFARIPFTKPTSP